MRACGGVAVCILVSGSSALLALVAILGGGDLSAPVTVGLIATVASLVAVGSLLRSSPSAGAKVAADKTATASVDDLIGMLDDTLMLARATQVDQQQTMPIDIPGLLAEIAARKGSLTVRLAGTPRAIVARGARVALGRAFEILIENARVRGTQTAIECDSGASMLVVHVDDNGMGIPRPVRERIFEWHYYMTTPPSARAGCSAELVIARQIARTSGGDIVVGASPMGGARFTLRLPLVGALPAEQGQAHAPSFTAAS